MPVDPLHESVEVPEPPLIVFVDREHVRPMVGETLEARLTEPVKPLSGASVMVDVPVAPATILTLVGLAETEKSGAAGPTGIVRIGLVLVREPDVALMVA